MIKLPNIVGLVQVGKTLLSAHRPEILYGAACASTLASVGLAAVGGYKSGQDVMRAEYSDLDLVSPDGKTTPLSTREKALLTWKNYIPAAVGTIGAVGSTTGLHVVHIQEKKAMATAALVALEEAKKSAKDYIEDYKASVEENVKISEKKSEDIEAALKEKQADRNGGILRVEDSDGVTEDVYLIRDEYSGRDFWSNKNRVDEGVNEFNNQMNGTGHGSLNDFYENVGLQKIPSGNDVGWQNWFMEIVWSASVRDDGRPIRVMAFRAAPDKGFDAYR